MSQTFFPSKQAFLKWLERHHTTTQELLLGFYKTRTKHPGLSYKEALDVALCYGWIDSVRKNIDEQRYSVRFSPRKKSSIWSQVNIKRMNELIAEGLAQPAGIQTFNERDVSKENLYSFEQQDAIALNATYERIFRAKKNAWKFFTAQAPSYRKAVIWFIMQAKQETTRRRRLDLLITASEDKTRLR